MRDPARVKGRFITAAIVLGLINVALLFYTLWPGRSAAQPAQLRQQDTTLKKEIALWKKSNPDVVRSQLKTFYTEDVPEKWSEISQRMERLFQASGVTSSGISYTVDTQDKSTLPGVQQVQVQTNVTGDYSKVAGFINALEQDKTFFIIDKISLSNQEGGIVSLSITVSTFLRQNA